MGYFLCTSSCVEAFRRVLMKSDGEVGMLRHKGLSPAECSIAGGVKERLCCRGL